MQLSTIIVSVAALLTIATGSPQSFPEPKELAQLEPKDVLEARVLQFNRGINIIKSYGNAINAGFSAGKVVITGAVQATGAISHVFTETNMGEHVVLAAYSHLRQSLAAIDTGSNAVNAVFQHATWRATFGQFNGATGATITAGIMLDTSTAILQLSAADFDVMINTIADYWNTNGLRVNEMWAASGNAFTGFPGGPAQRRRSINSLVARAGSDLTSQEVCRRPVDMRQYFSNDDAPQTTSTETSC